MVTAAKRFNLLAEFATEDGFQDVGNSLFLLFVKDREEGQRADQRVEMASSRKEARQHIRRYEQDGWRLAWKIVGSLYLPE